MINNVIDQLKRDEGLRLTVYLDQVGKRTIGYGHNLDAKPLPFDVTNGITLEQAANTLLADVIHVHMQLVAALSWFANLDEVRQGVFINMGFNLGVPGLLTWHHTLAAAQAGDYNLTADNMIQSAWYKEVGARAVRLVQQMRIGQWQ